jgi:hypothetical protein
VPSQITNCWYKLNPTLLFTPHIYPHEHTIERPKLWAAGLSRRHRMPHSNIPSDALAIVSTRGLTPDPNGFPLKARPHPSKAPITSRLTSVTLGHSCASIAASISPRNPIDCSHITTILTTHDTPIPASRVYVTHVICDHEFVTILDTVTGSSLFSGSGIRSINPRLAHMTECTVSAVRFWSQFGCRTTR